MTRATTFAIGLLLYAVALPVHAATITVTNTNDSGPGSLRHALTIANDGDTIGFAVTGTISLTSGELVIDKNITISGPGLLTVARDQQAADFRIFNIPPSHTAEIDGLTITGGSLVGNGGGISSGATLTISNCAISGNSILTTDGLQHSGAGIYNVGTMTIVNSTVNNNQALIGGFFPPSGGGISSDVGTLTIQNTTISENTVAGSGWGGGVYNAGSLTAINSTIRGNTASSGGGIFGGGATIINCTISGNSAVFEGGGIFGGGTISNCTISGNMTTVGHSRGGGISGSGTITNSTFSDNLSVNGSSICALGTVQLANTILNSGANIFLLGGTVTSHGYNLSSDNGGGFLNGPGDQINTDPLLGPLQDNGGPTFTHELLPGSPAIHTGDPNFTPPPTYDQRGNPFVRVFGGRIDIGSFEVQPIPRATPTPRPRSTPRPRPLRQLHLL